MKMYESRSSSPMLLILLSLLMASFFDTTAGQIGVCNGMLGNNLPNPYEVVALYQRNNIQRMRIYGPHNETLNALRSTGIELILDVPDVERMASSQTEADTWVRDNVQNYDGVRFRYLAVGNEVRPEYPAGKGRVLIQAMQNIEKAVSKAGLRVKVTTAIFMGGLTDTYPPSHGRFKDEYLDFLQPVIDFLVSKGSPLLLNNYPYFSYFYSLDSPNSISLEYALSQSTKPIVYDGPHNYTNLFNANLDSVYAALEKSRGGSLEIVVSETGWPTEGGPGTSLENARTYTNSLIQHVKNGSPRKPGKPIETYIFAMFNENKKITPPEVEKFFGLFLPNQQPKYDVNFN